MRRKKSKNLVQLVLNRKDKSGCPILNIFWKMKVRFIVLSFDSSCIDKPLCLFHFTKKNFFPLLQLFLHMKKIRFLFPHLEVKFVCLFLPPKKVCLPPLLTNSFVFSHDFCSTGKTSPFDFYFRIFLHRKIKSVVKFFGKERQLC